MLSASGLDCSHLLLHMGRCLKALNRVIIVRGGGGELLLASGAGPLFGGRNPSGTVPAPDVDD